MLVRYIGHGEDWGRLVHDRIYDVDVRDGEQSYQILSGELEGIYFRKSHGRVIGRENEEDEYLHRLGIR